MTVYISESIDFQNMVCPSNEMNMKIKEEIFCNFVAHTVLASWLNSPCFWVTQPQVSTLGGNKSHSYNNHGASPARPRFPRCSVKMVSCGYVELVALQRWWLRRWRCGGNGGVAIGGKVGCIGKQLPFAQVLFVLS